MDASRDDLPLLGLRGATRRKYKIDPDERLFLRMIRRGWLPPDDKLEEVRDSIQDVAINSVDPRARVAAARLLLDAEIEFVRGSEARPEVVSYNEEEPDELDGIDSEPVRQLLNHGNAESSMESGAPAIMPGESQPGQ